MPAEISIDESTNEVLLTFTYEQYGITPEEAERVGKELIQAAGQVSQQ